MLALLSVMHACLPMPIDLDSATSAEIADGLDDFVLLVGDRLGEILIANLVGVPALGRILNHHDHNNPRGPHSLIDRRRWRSRNIVQVHASCFQELAHCHHIPCEVNGLAPIHGRSCRCCY